MKTLVISFLLSIGFVTLLFPQTDSIPKWKKEGVQKRIDELNKQIKQQGFKWVAGVTINSYKSEEEIKKQFGEFYK